jgi:hypothetical protein
VSAIVARKDVWRNWIWHLEAQQAQYYVFGHPLSYLKVLHMA